MQPPLRGTLDGVLSIARDEGIFKLWRGLSPTLVMSVPATVIYFVGYDYLRDYMYSHTVAYPTLNQYSPLLSGAIARTLAATVISPIEMFRTRMQSTSGKRVFGRVLHGMMDMVKVNGPTFLWRGLPPTLWRDVPFSAMYWSGYEGLKRRLTDHYVTHYPERLDSFSSSFGISFLSGALSGSFAAVMTLPFDVAKTRQQVDVAHGGQQSRMLALMANIVKHEGWTALFTGIVPRTFKVAPACAIMISSYEISKKFFHVD